MAYTAFSVVFGEQPSASKWNTLGANDAGFRDGTNFAWGTSAVLTGGQKTTSTPSWTGGSPAIGDGTLAMYWQQVGKHFIGAFNFLDGSTTNEGSGDWTFGLPVTFDASIIAATGATTGGTFLGVCNVLDTGSALWFGAFQLASATTFCIALYRKDSGGSVYINSANLAGSGSPFTFAAGDSMRGLLSGLVA